MKNKMKLVGMAALTTLMFLGNFAPASAAKNQTTNEFEYLKDAMETIDAVPSEERNQYHQDNREWIDEIGERLDAYLETTPEEQQNDEVDLLYSDSSMFETRAIQGNLGDYFDDVWFHTRDGWDTYSMYPKWSVRLYGPTMKAAWNELGTWYSGIRNDNGSLWNQYKCHWDYDVFGLLAGSWDLERGRPIVSDVEMVRTLCNPE